MIVLDKIAITGFKGINHRVEIPAKSFNVIVGKNDAGKSTILKSLDIFLNNKKYEIDYLNNQAERFTQIELFFIPNSTSIIIDESISTTFEEEGIIDENGFLHITKRWDGTRTGKITPEYFVTRKHFGELDFFSLTEAKLIKLCKDNGLDAEPGLMTNPDTGEEHNNVEKRKRLREYFEKNGIDCSYIDEKLPTAGQTRQKKIESAIKICLPKFEYFLADSPLSESDASIQKYFKDMAFKVIQDKVNTNDLEDTVKSQLQEVLDKITEKINAVVPESEAVTPVVNFDWSKLISTGFESGNKNGVVPLSARGDGFRRITMMAYFEYLAEEHSDIHQNIIFGFEEPETFLHPSAQENLFEKLSDISSAGYQVFLTTHSPVLVAKCQKNSLHHIQKDGGSFLYNSVIDDYSAIADDLGITVDNQFVKLFESAKCLFLVEGIDDCNAFKHISDCYFNNQAIDVSLEDMGVVILPVGGCGSIKHWVSLDLLRSLEKKYYIYLDSDKTNEEMESPNYTQLIDYGFTEGVEFSVSRKRELENYIAPSALERIVPNCQMAFTDWCDVKRKAKNSPKSGALGGKKIARKHFSSLTYEELKSTFDPTENDDEFLLIYNKLKELV